MSERTWDKEAVYDEQISPLMQQVIAICKEHGIPVVASFEYANDLLCSTIVTDANTCDNLRRAGDAILAGSRATVPLMITTRDADGKVTNMTAIV